MEALNNNMIKVEENVHIKYNDLYFRLIACLIGAHLLVMMGENFSSLKAWTMWSYYPTLLINYIIALILAQIVRIITIKLDKRFSWENAFWPRLLLQFGIGVVGVSVLSFLLVLVYFVSFNQDIMQSAYPKYEFPFSIALLTLLNTYYVLYYFYHRVQILAGNELVMNNKDSYPTHLSVLEGTETVFLPVDEIAAFFIYENIILARSTTKKDYIVNYTLDELESKLLDPNVFFRVNRKLIANRSACSSYKPQGYGLAVAISPNVPVTGTISQRKASSFRKWFERSVA